MRKRYDVVTDEAEVSEESEETEQNPKQSKRAHIAFGFGVFFFLVGLAATFSFSAILWKADITWVQNLFDFFIFSFLFITYATPTAIIASVLSALCFVGARKTPHTLLRKIGIVLFLFDVLFLITAIIVAVQLA